MNNCPKCGSDQISNKGFDIDTQIIEYVQTNPGIMSIGPKLSAERVGDELQKMFSMPGADLSMRRMKEMGVINDVFLLPDNVHEKGWEMDQINPYHYENVWNHTLSVMGNLERRMDEEGIDPDHRFQLNLVGVTHDVGKLVEGKPGYQNIMEGDEIIRTKFVGHAEVSRDIALSMLERLRYPKNIIKRVMNLVENHSEADIELEKVGASDEMVARLIQKVGDGMDDLLLFASADREAHADGYNDPSFILETRDRLRQPGEMERYYDMLTPKLNGRDLMEIFGASKGGKWIGIINEQLISWQIGGEVNTPDEARSRMTLVARYAHGQIPEEERADPNAIDKILENIDSSMLKSWLGETSTVRRREGEFPMIEKDIVTGSDIIAAFPDRVPGPWLSAILKEMSMLRVNEGINNREEALVWLGSEEALAWLSNYDRKTEEETVTESANSSWYKFATTPVRQSLFSERNQRYFRLVSASSDRIDDVIDMFLDGHKLGEVNWDEIKGLLDDESFFGEMKSYYDSDPSDMFNCYQGMLEESISEHVASVTGVKVMAQQSVQLPSGLDEDMVAAIVSGKGKFTPDLSQLSGAFPMGVIDNALSMVLEWSSPLLDNIAMIAPANDIEEFGVYEEALTESIVKKLMHDGKIDHTQGQQFLSQKKGVMFRINPNRIISEADQLISTAQESDFDLTEEDRNLVMTVLLGGTIVHEASHADGAQDEGTAIGVERAFEEYALGVLNKGREDNPLPVSVKGSE